MDYNIQTKRLENIIRAKAYAGCWEEAEFFTEVKRTLEKLTDENEKLKNERSCQHEKGCKVCEGVNSMSGWGMSEKHIKRPIFYPKMNMRAGFVKKTIYASAIEGDFKYCPECGRPLTKGKKQNDEHE